MDKRIAEMKESISQLADDEKFDKLVEYANYAWRTNALESSEEFLQEAGKTKYFDTSKKYLARVLGIEAKIAYSRNMLDEALEKSNRALNIFKAIDDAENISRTLNNIGVYYSVLELNDKALEFFIESHKVKNKDSLPLSNAGEIYFRKGDYHLALDFYLQALEISKEKDSSSLGTIYNNLGDVYHKLGAMKKGQKFHLLGLEENQKKRLKSGIIAAWLGLGHYCLFNNDMQTALHYYDQALDLTEEIDNDEHRGYCFKAYIELYEKEKDFENLSLYLKKQLELREKVFFSKFTRRFLEIEAAIRSETKECEAKQMVEKSARLASIGVMAAGITHEINQPLSAIKVCADSMQFWDKRNPGNIPDVFKQELTQISRGVDRIDGIIRHMRSFWVTPGLEATEIIDLHSIITNSLSLVERQIKSHGILIKLDRCDEIPLVDVNRTHAEQIVINLVINSMHSLDAVEKDIKYIKLSTICQESKIIFAVEDNGKGIPEEYINQIFDPFYSTRKPGVGMGLGLAIVKQYLDEMNGQITVENREAGGVIVRITLAQKGKE